MLFPACAGVIPSTGGTGGRHLPFPRIRGGDPWSYGKSHSESYFSPHMRG